MPVLFMDYKPMLTTTEAAVLERIIEPDGADLPPEVARYLLSLHFPDADLRRMEELAAKSREAALSPTEHADLESYRRVGGLLDRLRARARQVLGSQAATPSNGESPPPSFAIPPGIQRSREALRRDLPQLLGNRKLRGKFVAYCGDERIGIADDDADLVRECLRRGLADDQYYLGVIELSALVEEEEVEYGIVEFGRSLRADRALDDDELEHLALADQKMHDYQRLEGVVEVVLGEQERKP